MVFYNQIHEEQMRASAHGSKSHLKVAALPLRPELSAIK